MSRLDASPLAPGKPLSENMANDTL